MGFTARSAFPRRVSARCLLSPAPRTRTRHRPRTLPSEPGFRRSFAPRYDEEELDPAAFASSSPASARRHTPLVDFCNRNDPQARPANRRNPPRGLAPPAFAGSADAWNGSSAPFGATRPSCQGSGTGWEMQLSPQHPPAPLAALARSESLAPTRLARTPPVVDSGPRWPEWPSRSVEPTLRWPPLSRDHRPMTRFRAVPGRAASRTLPRRRMRSAAPEVPSFAKAPLRGGPLSTVCPQPVEWGPGASAISAVSLPSTK